MSRNEDFPESVFLAMLFPFITIKYDFFGLAIGSLTDYCIVKN